MLDRNLLSVIQNELRSGKAPEKYKDPQEFVCNLCRDSSSQIYSFAMDIFRKITGTEYFEYKNVPEDEYFMTCDLSGEDSVIKLSPSDGDIFEIAPMLSMMTMIRRELRCSAENAAGYVDSLISASDTREDKAHKADESSIKISGGYDYGIIVNNKRSGRIMFQKMLGDDYAQDYTICTENQSTIRIAVSRREKKYEHITNPSTVRGRFIEPFGILDIDALGCVKIKIRMITYNDMDICFSCTGLDSDDMEIYDVEDKSIRFTRV
ncbi:MAG: hypothetical protein Q4F95_14480 [Oscillospiraceae bacterium]|nr:hypothetical protein [Oscillospiraceae bacterium]